VNALGTQWHPEHFACSTCGRTFAGGTFFEIDGKPYCDLHQNPVLAQNLADIVGSRYGLTVHKNSSSASTDFGNVSYALPALHPAFAIPTEPNGGNHSPGFEKSARSEAAHEATMVITRGLALLGFRVLTDDVFFAKVLESFEKSKAAQPKALF